MASAYDNGYALGVSDRSLGKRRSADVLRVMSLAYQRGYNDGINGAPVGTAPVVRSIYLDDRQWSTFRRLGSQAWLRAVLDAQADER